MEGKELKNLKQTHSAGLVVVYDGRILLVHPTKEKSHNKTYSFPKGKIEFGETPEQAAIRETFEETGIKFDIKKLKGVHTDTFQHFFENVNILKTYTYFLYPLKKKEFQKLFKGEYVIPYKKLDLKEIDVAGFYTIEEANNFLAERFSTILNHVEVPA